MSAATVVTWACDMCDDTEDRSQAAGAPAEWIGVTLHPTATHAESSRRLHVCDRCMKLASFAHLIAATGGTYS